MTKRHGVFLLIFLWLILIPGLSPTCARAADPGPQDRLSLAGSILNTEGRGVKEADVEVLVNGRHLKPEGKKTTIVTGSQGGFLAQFHLPAGTLAGARVEIQAKKPNWRNLPPAPVTLLPGGTDQSGNNLFQAQAHLTLLRAVTPAFWIATLVLFLVYALIAFELMHRTLAAFLGAAAIMFISYVFGTFNPGYFVISFDDAMRAIDMNVIFLLMGMMIIVGVLKKTGLFQWLAYKSFAMARGNIYILAGILMVVTAVASAFLDNVTTMLLMIPVTIEIAVALKLNPIALLIPEVFASNVGGTATLIGDPPNILIGSYANLSFGAFLNNLTLVVVISMVFSVAFYIFWYRRSYKEAEVKDVERTTAYMKQEYRITDKVLLIKCLVMLVFTILLFVLHGVFHMEPSIAALTGAMLLLAISGVDIVEMLEHEVEWPTLVFFMALFIVVAGAEETGLIQFIAEWVAHLSQGNLVVAVILVLWVSALASAAIDNIPFTATMLPIVAFLNQTIPGAESGVLWWALSLGACFGGNGTMIGASANVVTVGLAEKAGYHISFMAYIKACMAPMLVTVVIATVYLLLAY
ncbi:MAG: ArsB/NhaD family transporter [Deltaproteobacteria bacterium]|nr:ArsB/NhaD family transporter [Deltaproteobacteria bacterium]